MGSLSMQKEINVICAFELDYVGLPTVTIFVSKSFITRW